MAFDLFPSHISDILFDLNSLKDIDPKHRPQTWLSMDPQHYVAYCPSSNDLRVMFHRFHPFREEHFVRLITTARKSIKTENSLSRQDFNRITTRLLRPPGNTTINTDVRALYKLDNNVFVVNALFTFGLFTVKGGEKHIYRSNSAILLCHMPDVRTLEGRNPPTLIRRSFCQEDFTYFKMSVLRPNETYYVPEGTRYLIITLKKSYFIVDKVLAGTEIPGALPFNEHQNYMPDIYNVPPPTPSAPFMRPNDRHKRKAASRDISEVKKPRRLPDVEILSPRPLHSRAATVSRVPPSPPTSSHMHPVQREGDLPEEQHVHSSPVNPPEELHTHSAPVQREGDLPEEQHVHSSPVNPPEDFHIHSASVQRECDPPLNNDSDGPLVTDEELFTTAELDKYLLFQFPETSATPLPDYSMLETRPVFDTLLYSPISVAPTPSHHRETHYNVLEMPIHTSDEVTERGEAPPLFNAPDISETTPDFDTPRYSPISEAPTPNQEETHDHVSPIQDSDEVTFLVEHLSSPPFVTPGVPLSSVEREVFLTPPPHRRTTPTPHRSICPTHVRTVCDGSSVSQRPGDDPTQTTDTGRCPQECLLAQG
ncbi:hypothetical protein JTE90_017572 [Oedothorax gibbosus]|uniref:Uncharacterized protein n=1 Tax=Oedothorax gibbosus TaxID=931172 RepID=A0AAV6TLD4_9ARAC|nr:hypothetical protein JTE90_017572 [Oedothorax gibbosus]